IADFETFEVEENLHVAINVKDFKAAIAHADSLKVAVSARYSWPKSPMQLQYFSRGFSSTFTFMTIDGNRGGSGNATSGARLPTANRAKTASRPSTAKGLAVERPPRTREASEMPPPPQRLPVRSFAQDSNTQQSARPSPPPPRASIDHDSLFLPQEDREERIWAEKDPDAEDDELGWDASEDHDAFASTIQRPRPTVSGSSKRPAEPDDVVDDLRIAPSQRVSQVPGLFDD
ncbi:hypothetical protein MMC25_000405, partial [Agyrium rufum]|nr:hypothetical protein [Agyrium rufum]